VLARAHLTEINDTNPMINTDRPKEAQTPAALTAKTANTGSHGAVFVHHHDELDRALYAVRFESWRHALSEVPGCRSASCAGDDGRTS
jgi:hypothetical protein